MKTIEDIKAAILAIAPDTHFNERITHDRIEVFTKFKEEFFRQTIYFKTLEIDKDEVLAICYERIYFAIKERVEDPEGIGAKIRQAEFEQWLDNIENQIGDKHGELFPTTEQILESIKKK